VAVDCGVAVGDGVRLTTGGAVGVGVGPTATIGPLGVALAEGPIDGEGLAEAGGVDSEAPGTADGVVGVPPGPDVEGLAAGGDEPPGAATLGTGEAPPAMPRSGWAGATRPAVSATVARTRLRSPIATTRRARWLAVTTAYGLLPTGQWRRSRGDPAMVAPGPLRRPEAGGLVARWLTPTAPQPMAAAARAT